MTSITICDKIYEKDITVLDLRNHDLISIPSEVFQLTKLEQLILQDNYITEIPEEICLLTTLRVLNLENNRITTLPEQIGSLTNLVYLNISDNNLTSISNSISNLYKLYDLYLDNNYLTEFPLSICELENLQELCLTANRITSIPQDIHKMHALDELYIAHNRLTSIPVELCTLQNLSELSIQSNNITELPIDIVNLANLQYFRYSDNPIDNLLNPIISRFLQRFESNPDHYHNMFDDSQNVHASSIQQCTKESMYKLLQQLKDNQEYDFISDDILTQRCKQILVEYSQDKSIHSQLECTFSDVLKAVFYEISLLDRELQILSKQRLNEEMLDSECKCFTGRLTRLVNSLSGISDKVSIKISDSEEIGNIISVAQNKFKDIDQVKDYVQKELKDRGYADEIISQWLEHIE